MIRKESASKILGLIWCVALQKRGNQVIMRGGNDKVIISTI